MKKLECGIKETKLDEVYVCYAIYINAKGDYVLYQNYITDKRFYEKTKKLCKHYYEENCSSRARCGSFKVYNSMEDLKNALDSI